MWSVCLVDVHADAQTLRHDIPSLSFSEALALLNNVFPLPSEPASLPQPASTLLGAMVVWFTH